MGKGIAVVLLLGAVVGLTDSPASGQEPAPLPETEVRLGSRIPWRIEQTTPTQREAARVLYRFGRCTIEDKPEDSMLLMRSRVSTPGQGPLVRRLTGSNNRCLTGAQSMSMNFLLLRGAIANALYLRDYPNFPSDRLPIYPAETALRDEIPRWLVSNMAYCIVRTDPSAVDALLRTRVASNEEEEVLQRISTLFGACLFRDQTLQTNALMIRSALADAAYTSSLGEATADGTP